VNAARNWTLAFIATAIAVVICYAWLDRPIAELAHIVTSKYKLFERLTHIVDAIIPIVIAAFVILGICSLAGRGSKRLATVILLCGVSLAVGEGVKNQLKIAFSRTWPETWIRNNPSFIRDHVFGFFPFHGGPGYASFPSGHEAAICAVMSVLWLCYPRWRALYALAVVGVAIGLVGANFHFLGDVIAGGFLGSLVGAMVVTFWDLGVRPIRGSADPKAAF
jgi:membrane-associated phospholipid phosphatase